MDDIEKKRKRDYEDDVKQHQHQHHSSSSGSRRFDQKPPGYDDRSYNNNTRGFRDSNSSNSNGSGREYKRTDYRDDRYHYNNSNGGGGRDRVDDYNHRNNSSPPHHHQYQQQQQQHISNNNGGNNSPPISFKPPTSTRGFNSAPAQPISYTQPTPVVIPQQPSPIDQERLKKEREEEKQRDQEKLDEEMRKRREKVELWRKQKMEAEAKNNKSSTAATTATTPTTTASTGSSTNTSNSVSNTAKWSLEEEDEDDTKQQPLPPTSSLPPPPPILFKQQQQQDDFEPMKKLQQQQQQKQQEEKKEEKKEEEEEEDDDIDPLDAFMENLNKQEMKKNSTNNNNKQNKQQTKQLLENGEDAEGFEEESDDENDKDKVVKKGKREILAVDHSKIDYPSFEKNFYVEVPILANMSLTEVKDYRSELGLKINGKDCPKPIQLWAQVGLNEKIHLLLKKYQYEKPTPIQAQTVPAIMSGKDIIGIAKTGSGKTLAFLLPLFRHVLAQPKSAPGEGMIALIMSPTRELALQIYAECKKFSIILGLRVACVYGGASISEQIADLKRGADIVVCTPGRMIDILCANNKRITNLKRVTFLVLDEADRMFDMGFGPQIMCIIDNIRPDRQTIMFSATFPPKVENVAKKILTRPLEIVAGGRSVVSSEIEQFVEVRPDETRFRRLMELLSTWYHKGQILIFTNRQETTDNLFRQITASGYECLSLHGSKDQMDRDETISDFKNKIKTILIATPLASRGLDIKDLNLVINFDCPDHLEDYVHRVGRTGRAGNKGTAYTFITPDDDRYATSIVKALQQSGAKVPDELLKLEAGYNKKKQDGKEVLYAPTGFTGRGHKFDAAEEEKKDLQRKLQKKAYGIEDDEDEPEATDLDKVTPPTIDSATGTSAVVVTDSTTSTTSTTTPSTTDTITSPTNTTLATGTTTTTTPISQENLPVGVQAINKFLVESIKPVSTRHHGTHFVEELEINDYPQQARWKVTHKDGLNTVTDFTGTTITTKGTYFPPNKLPQAGERKLYLYIEGPSETAVKGAKAEILKILDETSALGTETRKYSHNL